ncbi:MAG: hypothetical protein DMG13_28785 [Acidobacteria bacterium]|nr:MAG: hypothetical protein DMG13_28785 [Acidobacteriota bacterium]
MNKIAKFVLACSMSLPLAAPALAHHSAAAYDTQQEVKMTGTITEYKFKNPHVYMTLQVRKADGSTAAIEIEAGAASVLSPLGFNRDSLAVGDVVTVIGNPARSNSDKFMLGKDLYKSDGAYYPLNIASRSIYTARNEIATSIAGTWFSPRTEFNAFLGGARNWPVTEKGKAAMANVDPKATTQKDCIPIGAPALMFYPVANTITVQRDRVVMKVDWMDSERIIYLDGRKHPPAGETFLHGHSVGRWEGDTLVVETTNFKEHPMGLSTSLPSSTRKRLTERFGLSQDGKSLIYSGVIEDPVYLARPVEWSGQWLYRPNMPHANEKCDIDVAHKFLRN